MFPSWMSIKNWFWHSEVVFWAQAQMFVGIVWTVLSQTDLAPLLDPKWLTFWLIASGAITQYLRVRGTETVTLQGPSGITAKILSDKPLPDLTPPGI